MYKAPLCRCTGPPVRRGDAATQLLPHLSPLDGDPDNAREYVCPLTLVHWQVIGAENGMSLRKWTPGPRFPIG